MRETGGTKSRSWSIGITPLTSMSAFVETNDGMTSPGQSHRINDSSRYNVYKQIAVLSKKNNVFVMKQVQRMN